MTELDAVGSRIRAARQARGLSLRALAEKVGVSASMLSLLENGRSRSSIPTLYAVVEALDMSMDELFSSKPAPAEPARVRPASPVASPSGGGPSAQSPSAGSSELMVVRADNRRRIEMESGVVWEQLGHNDDDGVEFMLVTYPPGASSSDSGRYQRHNGLECAHVMQGELTCKVAFEEVTLHAGDSITFDSSRPHLLENNGTVDMRAVWLVLRHRAPAAEAGPAADQLAQQVAQHLPNVVAMGRAAQADDARRRR
ncbi:cupin domain-containing protein [Dactylosporangium sp. AC04546]|uniref:helix-turn-helix domain-containing protein n=1 Tax=Dactylosporangium sp. AC04546 TaxID=2862460 RepID=UPI001EE10129|nr:cupin domain-containing protein [Dactylosporangium sp. AC04546]WVK79380.1 cupin domain-containing protein [Dactylosporangium sp. AC04546]